MRVCFRASSRVAYSFLFHDCVFLWELGRLVEGESEGELKGMFKGTFKGTFKGMF